MLTRTLTIHHGSQVTGALKTYRAGAAFGTTLLPNEPRIANPALAQSLSDRFLTPALADIEALLLHVRATLDPMLTARQPNKNGKPYPLGQCLEISKAVEERLKELRSSDVPAHLAAGFEALQQYKQHGGNIRLVWGDLRGQYFQNAFLVGIYYMDVSNDTVFVTKPKVEILPLQDANFHRIEDYAHFSRVAKSYWKVALYPNHVLPELAPFCPLIAVYPSGAIQLQSASGYMAMLNIRSRFKHAEQMLQEPAVDAKHLPLMTEALVGFEGVELSASAHVGRQAALKAVSALRRQRHHAVEIQYNKAYKQVLNINAHLSKFRLVKASSDASELNAPVQPALELPPMLQNTDALEALLKKAAASLAGG